MAAEPIRLEVRRGVGEITLTEGDRGNPFDDALCDSFLATVQRCTARPDIRAILILAQGDRFSVGGDLKWLGKDRDRFATLVGQSVRTLNTALSMLAHADAPVVVGVQGVAAGGAIGLIAAADVVVATPAARFVAAFATLGFSMDSGSSFFLPRRVGNRRATDFYLLNQTWSAQQAFEHGLVSQLAGEDELKGSATAIAEQLASGPTKAFGEMRRLLLGSSQATLDQQLDAEAAALLRCTTTEDSWNAITALLDKRQPRYSGR